MPRRWAMSLSGAVSCKAEVVTRTIDYTALTAPVDRAEVKMFRESARSRPGYATTSAVVTVIIVILMVFLFGFIFLGILGGVVLAIAEVADSPSGAIAGFVVPAVLVAGFVAVAVLIIRSVLRGGKWERWYRFDRFATANGLTFSPMDADPQYPGAIFQFGNPRAALDHFRSLSGRFLDYGNYRYTTGSGKNRTTRTWGFMALRLDRALPNMVLDSNSNNGIFGSNLPATFDKNQVLKLEGNFNDYFTLYCPREYERDALYIFTPDLMALLIDNAAPFDVEIVDEWMFVYSSSTFDFRQPAVHQRLLGIVDTVGAKTLSQTDRYRDERVADFAANVVAPQGRRLKQRVSIWAIIIIVIFATGWLWPFFGGIFSSLLGR